MSATVIADRILTFTLTLELLLTVITTLIVFRIGTLTGFFRGWASVTVGFTILVVARFLALLADLIPAWNVPSYEIVRSLTIVFGFTFLILGFLQVVEVRLTMSEGKQHGHRRHR